MSARPRPPAWALVARRRAAAAVLMTWRRLAVAATVTGRRWPTIGTGTTRRRLAAVEADLGIPQGTPGGTGKVAPQGTARVTGMGRRGLTTIGAGMGTWRKGLTSVRLRATLAATLVVAVALGAAALTLVNVLSQSLQDNTSAEAFRRAVAYAGRIETLPAPPVQPPAHQDADGKAPPGPPARESADQKAPPGPPARQDDDQKIPPGPPARERAADGKAPAVLLPIRTGDDNRPPRRTQVMLTGDPDVWVTPGRPLRIISPAAADGFVVANTLVYTRSGPAVVWARASLAGAQQALDRLNGLLLPGVPALLLVVAGMTWFSVGRALAPVAAIRSKVADITARDLHRRVPVPRARDEIAALATTVNGTLDRLETAVGTHKRFVADAAHELRSPIATLRARLELAEPSELTEEALADVERLQTLAADLLLLAKLDAGEPLRTDDLHLGQVAAEESLRAKRRPDVRVKLDVDPETRLRGSRAHLARLVTNLVDNAARHAATTVEVRVWTDGDEAVLQVLDDGPGIPPEHREAVFDRFTRLDEARARDAGGAGLGLPIAREIAVLHGGTLTAGDGGCTARFPAATPEDRHPEPK